MTATQLVGHLHFGQVEVLRATALRLERNRILEEGWFGRVSRRKPVGQNRLGCLFLIVGFGLIETLPFPIFVLFSLVVLAEITANGLYKNRILALVVATFCYEIGHHAA